MNKLFTLILLILISSCKTQNCSDVKTGTFIIERENSVSSILIRNESTQEELINELGVHMKYDLIWIDECSYALFNSNTIKGKDSIMEERKKDTLFLEITEVTDSAYQFIAS